MLAECLLIPKHGKQAPIPPLLLGAWTNLVCRSGGSQAVKVSMLWLNSRRDPCRDSSLRTGGVSAHSSGAIFSEMAMAASTLPEPGRVHHRRIHRPVAVSGAGAPPSYLESAASAGPRCAHHHHKSSATRLGLLLCTWTSLRDSEGARQDPITVLLSLFSSGWA